MLHLLIYAVIGVVAVCLVAYLFARLGNNEPAGKHMDEETLVRTYSDPTLVNLYYKAHTDADRQEIVNFICSNHGLEAPQPRAKEEIPPQPEKKTISPLQAKMDEILAGNSEPVSDRELVGEILAEDEDVMSFTQFEMELESKRADRMSGRSPEVPEPQQSAEPLEEPEPAAEPPAEAPVGSSIIVRSSGDGQVETFSDLNAAIAAAIAKVEPARTDSPEASQEIWAEQTVIMEKPVETTTQPEESSETEVAAASPVMEAPEAEAVAEETAEPEGTPAEEESQRFCIYCGAPLETGFKFCMICGMPLETPEEPAGTAKSTAEAPAQEEPVQEEKPLVELKKEYSNTPAAGGYSVDKPNDMLQDTIFDLNIPPILSLEEILDNVREMDQKLDEGGNEKRDDK